MMRTRLYPNLAKCRRVFWWAGIAASVVVTISPLRAARLMPDPALTVEEVRAFAEAHTAPGAKLGDLRTTIRPLDALHREIECEAELVLRESLYVEVPRSDSIFDPVRELVRAMEQAKRQLELVPKTFVASIGGRKHSENLPLLTRTLVRTSVPQGATQRIQITLAATHNGRWFGGAWAWRGPSFAVAEWRGAPLASYPAPLPVDGPDFARELATFRQAARAVLDEIRDISVRYVARVDSDRAALVASVPPGTVLEVPFAEADRRPLFLETKHVDGGAGFIVFALASGYFSKSTVGVRLTGVIPDPAQELRGILRDDQAKAVAAASVAPAKVATAPEKSSPTVASLADFLRGAGAVELGWREGQPVLQRPDVAQIISLSVVPDTVVREKRAQFAREASALIEKVAPGAVLRGSIGRRECLLGSMEKADGRLRFTLQFDANGNERTPMMGELLTDERDHPALRLRTPSPMQGSWKGELILSLGSTGDLRAEDELQSVVFTSAPEMRVRPSGRVLPAGRVAVDELKQRRAGLYVDAAGRLTEIAASPSPFPSESGSGYSEDPGSIRVRFPIDAAVVAVKRDAALFSHRLRGTLLWLPLAKGRLALEFTAARAGRGYSLREQDLRELPGKQIEDDVCEFSLDAIGVGEVGAVVLNGSENAKFYLVRIEP